MGAYPDSQSYNYSLPKQMKWLSSAPCLFYESFFFFGFVFSPLCWVIAYKVNVVLKILATKVLESYWFSHGQYQSPLTGQWYTVLPTQ